MGDRDMPVVRIEEDIGAIPAALWDACANPDPARANPFLSHAFLHALEASGSAAPATGWAPQHLVIDGGDGRALGIMPCYLKAHSQGEYVFDHGWADAYERAGGRYYPKLQAAVPFTPVTGRRLLVPAGADRVRPESILIQAALKLVALHGASSLHITFLTGDEWRRHGGATLLQRVDQQFHWRNDGYDSFDDFLGALASRKRKAVRRERGAARQCGVSLEWVTGTDLTEAHWDAFFAFYMDTGGRKWGRPYLNRRFFSLIGESLADRILLVIARRAGRMIAGALNFIGGDTLYGRYWGALEHHPFLHFEACYYQAIDFAIAHGLARVEAGAQGDHKLARGYLPHTTYSLHYLANPSLHRAVADYLRHERPAVEEDGALLSSYAPFRKAGSDSGS